MPKQLKAALAAAALLVLFLNAQGTAALWRAEATIDAGSVQTGNLHLLAGNGTTAKDNFAFVGLEADILVPGGFIQAPLTITNGGTTDLDYTLVGASTSPASPTTEDSALGAVSILSIHSGMESTDCANNQPLIGSPLFEGPATTNATFPKVRALAAEGSTASAESLCVRIAIPDEAPQAASGGRINLVLNFVGQQR